MGMDNKLYIYPGVYWTVLESLVIKDYFKLFNSMGEAINYAENNPKTIGIARVSVRCEFDQVIEFKTNK